MSTRFAILTMTVAGLLLAGANAADSPADRTVKLIAVLQSNAPLFDKARACQQLGEFGDREAVPVLAALLGDEHLSAYARSGLEGIPDPSASEAMRVAAGTLKGLSLSGVINSLGVLRDAKAVPLLSKLAGDPASGAATEAMLALGRISTDESIALLRQALVRGPETNRVDAAAACFLAAEKQLADGHSDTAVSLYDAVRAANVPLTYRAAATHGAIVARKTSGIPLLIEQLRSNERIFRNTAFMAIREMPGDALANALNAALADAPSELQVQLLVALADCHNAQSLSALRTKAGSDDAEVRKTALTVLGRIGGATEVGVLLNAVADNRSAEECAVALNGLERMEGTAIDEQIVNALVATTNPAACVHFIRLLEVRTVTQAAGVLLEKAASPDMKVSETALGALKLLAGSADLPALMAILKSSKDETVRQAAGNAVIGVCTRTGRAASGSEVVLVELKQAKDPAVKNSWIRILAALGDARALPAILAAMNDADESVAANALEHLARWPDPTPIADLLALAQTSPNPARRKRALASAIQLATTAADEHQRPDETVARWFGRAREAAQTAEDRRLILSGLGRLKHLESLLLLRACLDDKEVRNEAAIAILQIAPGLRPTEPATLRDALDRIVATSSSPDLRKRAADLAATVSSQARRMALFDGQTLAGWEGNTSVWRVRDGAIVGGSLAGNPRNEFLATTASYTNFVLRLEYKLVGTEGFVNGGVQVRSQRVRQPPNEVSGYQADIGAGFSGCLYDESRRNTILARPTDEQIKRWEKPGEWNRYEVRCAGPRIQIALNGEKTVDYTEADAAMPLDGRVALQIHGSCQAEIAFRNLSIEDVSYGVATREFALAKARWKVLSCSSENTLAEDERAVLAIDGNPDTFWHTLWNGAAPGHPHHLAVDLGQEVEVNGFACLPRQDGRHVKGVIGEYEFYVSRDGQDWGTPVGKGRFEKSDLDASGRVVLLPRSVAARYFKLVSLSAPDNQPYAGAAEIDVLGRPTPQR
jgi:HEAT repeat protein